MDAPRTVPLEPLTLPVRALRVDVLEGPDAGQTASAAADHLTVGTATGNDLTLTDSTVSRYHVELIRGAHGTNVIDHQSTNGTFIGSARIERATIPPGTSLRLGRTVVRVVDGDSVAVALHARERFGDLLGASAVMRRLMAQLERAAQSDVAVLLLGESGTGKEVIARALQDQGERKGRPFVTVDCAALTPTLVASELFGHERGAFTGADRPHIGAFERANSGTLFLDEIGELPAALQAMMLGVLERRRFRRLGGNAEIAVDVRVISATNRDLRAEVNAGRFRLDLYYRLAVVALDVPPLRDRTDDIPMLVEHFLRECGSDEPVETVISAATLESLQRHTWPGNVRELRNLIEATFAMGELPALRDGRGNAPSTPAPRGPLVEGKGDLIDQLLDTDYRTARARLLESFEARYLRRLLERTDDNVTHAARLARMDRSHLIDLLHRHGIR
jgi:DNA-binding NtrC family response regulator